MYMIYIYHLYVACFNTSVLCVQIVVYLVYILSLGGIDWYFVCMIYHFSIIVFTLLIFNYISLYGLFMQYQHYMLLTIDVKLWFSPTERNRELTVLVTSILYIVINVSYS